MIQSAEIVGSSCFTGVATQLWVMVSACLALPCAAQTVVEVPQALVVRNRGTVQVVSKDGQVRDVSAQPTDPWKAGQPKKKPDNNLTSSNAMSAVSLKWPTTTHVIAGEVVRTGRGSSVDLALQGAGTIRIEPDSEVKIPEGNGAPTAHSLEVLKGQLFISIDAQTLKKQGNQEFRLKTPTTILAVKGTRFFVQSASEQDTIGVHGGEVAVLSPVSKKAETVQSGSAVTASKGSLSGSRPFTAQEKAWDSVYPDFEIVRVPTQVVLTLGKQVSGNSGVGIQSDDVKAKLTVWARGIYVVSSDMTKDKPKEVAALVNLSELPANADGNRMIKCRIKPPSSADSKNNCAAGLMLSIQAAMPRTRQAVGVEFLVLGSGVNHISVFSPAVFNFWKTAWSISAQAAIDPPTAEMKWANRQRFTLPLLKSKGTQGLRTTALAPWTETSTAQANEPDTQKQETQIYVVTYPNERQFTESGKELELLLGNFSLLLRHEK